MQGGNRADAHWVEICVVYVAQKAALKKCDFLHKNILTLVDKRKKIVYNSGA